MTPIKLRSSPDEAVFDCHPGQSILEAALQEGLPMAHACGGKARCSTCRIWITEGNGLDPPPGDLESALTSRLKLGSEIRLACQFRPNGPVAFRRLVIDQDDLAVANQLDRGRPAEAGETGKVAVLFFDIANFSVISRHLPPYDTMFLLNKFLTLVVRILSRHGGYFDKAIGDGFMAIFGIHGESDCPLHAVAAALKILKAVDVGKPVLRELYGIEFDARIGIHYGEALIGALGPAGEDRLTVIGDVANIASRIESANKEADTRLLISEETFNEVRGDVISPDFIRLRVPGADGRRTLYEVTGLTRSSAEKLKHPTRLPPESAPGRNWMRLLDSDALGEMAVRIVPQPRYDIALTRQNGQVFAFNNHCPHNRLSFFGDEIPDGAPLPPTPACSNFPEPGRIACRFHGSEFDLENGRIISWCPRLTAEGYSPGLEILGDLSKNEHPLEVYRCCEYEGGIWVEID